MTDPFPPIVLTDRPYRHLSDTELAAALGRAHKELWDVESRVDDMIDEQRYRAQGN